MEQRQEIYKHQELTLANDLNGRVGQRLNDKTVGCFEKDVLYGNREEIIELDNLHIADGFTYTPGCNLSP